VRIGWRIAIGLTIACLVVPFARAAEHAASSSAGRCSNAPCPSTALVAVSTERSSPWPGSAAYERMAPSASQAGQGEGRAHAPTGNTFEGVAESSEIDKYLCSVYWRMPNKIDGAGDFSWKDAAAATRSVRTVCDYAINGMHPDLREILYALGRTFDGAGINWSFLSAFRDDFRQSIAAGFKASACGSLHGGSCRTKGWGDGRAADLWIADLRGYPAEDASLLLDLIDRVGPSSGLARPMPQADPAHVQVGGDWQVIGKRLREARVRGEATASITVQRRCATSLIHSGC
jgi:hypothetical protein